MGGAGHRKAFLGGHGYPGRHSSVLLVTGLAMYDACLFNDTSDIVLLSNSGETLEDCSLIHSLEEGFKMKPLTVPPPRLTFLSASAQAPSGLVLGVC